MIEKDWGYTKEIYYDNKVHIYLNKMDPFSFCSIHSHKYKTNYFISFDGELTIRKYYKDTLYEYMNKVYKRNELAMIGPNVLHRMENNSPNILTLIEYYIPSAGEKLSKEDIERYSIGGQLDIIL